MSSLKLRFFRRAVKFFPGYFRVKIILFFSSFPSPVVDLMITGSYPARLALSFIFNFPFSIKKTTLPGFLFARGGSRGG